MCKLGCRTELLQSRARAKVPTALKEEEKHYENNETEIILKHCDRHASFHLLNILLISMHIQLHYRTSKHSQKHL